MLTLNRLKATVAAFALPLALGATVSLAHAQTPTLEPQAPGEQQPLRVDPPAAPDTAPAMPPAIPDEATPQAAAPQAPSPGSSAEAAPDGGGSTAAVTQDLIGQPVLDIEGAEVGSVASLKVDPSGRVEEIHVKTGGVFLGLGSTTYIVPSGKFTETGKDVKLSFAKSQLDQMPELDASKS